MYLLTYYLVILFHTSLRKINFCVYKLKIEALQVYELIEKKACVLTDRHFVFHLVSHQQNEKSLQFLLYCVRCIHPDKMSLDLHLSKKRPRKKLNDNKWHILQVKQRERGHWSGSPGHKSFKSANLKK